jgi:radical SAM superfamily enzyme YgiQ (UPF0313 family)
MDFIILTNVSGLSFQRSIGAYQIAHFLRKNNITTQVVDFTDYFTFDELKKTLNKFITEKTISIGISSTFYSNSNEKFVDSNRDYSLNFPENISEILLYIKNNFPNIKLVLGGARANNKYSSFFDAVFNGYSENEILGYLLNLKKSNKQFTFEKFLIENLDHRFTDNDCITHKEVLPIEISRGCIFKCKFCAYPLNGKNKNDYIRDADLVAEEMLYNYEKFNVTNYFFVDDTFNDNNYKLEILHAAISKLPFKINFTCYLRIDLLYRYRHQISLLREMGLSTPFFGIESFNQKTCTAIGKGLDVNLVKNFLCELYYDIWKSEIPFYLAFIVGLPHENRDSLEKTVEWLQKYDFTGSFQPLTLFSNSIYKSDLEMNYAKYGYTLDKNNKWFNDNFSEDEAIELTNQINSNIVFKNSKPSSWFFMSLLNHGYDIEELKNTRTDELNWFKIKKEKYFRIKEYKDLLLKSTNF